MPSLKDLRNPHRLHQGDAEDHQGHADGRGLEAAARAGRGRSGAAFRRAHGEGAGQHRRRGGGHRCRAEAARGHRPRPGASADRLRPASAAWPAPSTPPSCGLRANTPMRLIADGKEVKILTVGRKGYDQMRRLFQKQIVDRVELRGVRTLGYENAEGIAVKVRRAVRSRRVRRRDAVLFALQVGDLADPHRAADHPAGVPEARRGRSRPRPMNTSRTKRKSSPSCCRVTSRCRSTARCWRTPLPSTARR